MGNEVHSHSHSPRTTRDKRMSGELVEIGETSVENPMVTVHSAIVSWGCISLGAAVLWISIYLSGTHLGTAGSLSKDSSPHNWS